MGSVNDRKSLALTFKVASVVAACGITCSAWAGIDHQLPFDESGIWARSNQKAVEGLSAITVLGGALWEGNDTRLGRTFWKASEAMAIADISAEVLKRTAGRPRPSEINDPDLWRQGSQYRSFPSGEVTHITGIVTPFIAEYAHDTPAVWGLAALPLYVGAARLKSQAHWQTDVLAGVALGAGVGYYEAGRDSAWSAGVLPHGLTVGFKTLF